MIGLTALCFCVALCVTSVQTYTRISQNYPAGDVKTPFPEPTEPPEEVVAEALRTAADVGIFFLKKKSTTPFKVEESSESLAIETSIKPLRQYVKNRLPGLDEYSHEV